MKKERQQLKRQKNEEKKEEKKLVCLMLFVVGLSGGMSGSVWDLTASVVSS